MSAREKIKGQHLERLAIVYLRQSSPRQVRENFRSTERQYALAEEAVRLGWESERVVVIDGDLGISGRFSDTQAREGYKGLVARVCLGEVGAIFGLEVSRLARSNAELQRLLEFCALTDTLVLDTDGIYDLQDINDRLLLGLKAQMSEAELHIITSRLQGAKRAAAQRGELRFPLPVGLVHDEEGQTIIDPDEEVQAAVGDVFRAFEQTGSAYGVVGVFKGRRFPKRAYGGAWAGQLRWGELTHPRVLGVLSNPSYAGAYVFGRYRSRRALRPDGTITTKILELPRSEWLVLIREHHKGYISWETYLANERRLKANDTHSGQCPPREGRAICQGMLRCGACGGSMTTLHRRESSYYECGHSRADHVNTPACRSVKAAVVDELIARRLLEALAPEEIALALAAAEELTDRRARSTRAAGLRVERARYDAVRAERAFHACGPEKPPCRPQPRDPVGAEAPRADRGGSRARRAERARPGALARADRGTRARCPQAVGRRDNLGEGPQTAAAHDDHRHHDHLPAHRPRASGWDPLALGRQRAAHHPATEDAPRGHPHPGRGDRADQTPRRRSHQRADRRATEPRRVARRHRRPDRRRACAMDPRAPQDPVPDQLGTRR
ncbi:MAG: recombinase family protein [Solirubrobacteraceae bacterium]